LVTLSTKIIGQEMKILLGSNHPWEEKNYTSIRYDS